MILLRCNDIYFDEACLLNITIVSKLHVLKIVYNILLSKRHQISVNNKIFIHGKEGDTFQKKNADYCPPKKWEFHIGPSLGRGNESTLHFMVCQHVKHQFAVFRAFPLGKGSNKLLTSPTCKIRKNHLSCFWLFTGTI